MNFLHDKKGTDIDLTLSVLLCLEFRANGRQPILVTPDHFLTTF